MPEDNDALTENVVREWHELAGLGETGLPDSPYGNLSLQRAAWWRTLCMDTTYEGIEVDDDNDLPLRRDYERANNEYGNQYEEKWLAAEHEDINSVNGNQRSRRSSRVMTFWAVDERPGLPRRSSGLGRASPAAFYNKPNFTPKHETESIDDAVTTATANRRFFITKKGYMGLGPIYLKKEDMVWVFAGGNTPFLARKAGSREIGSDGHIF